MARTWPNNAANRLRIGANPSRLSFPANGEQFTLSGWVKLTTNDATDMTLISKYDGSKGPLMRTLSGKLRMFWIDSGTTGHEAIGGTTMSTGTWYHVAATWAAAGGMTVYLNGVSDGTDATTTLNAQSDTTDGWTLGARSSATFPLNGVLCEVAMWNTAISANEILALSKGVNPFMVRPANLKGYWPIYGVAGPENDLSDGSNNFNVVGTLAATNHAPVGPPSPHSALTSMLDPGLTSSGNPPINTVAPSIIAWPEVGRLEASDGGTWTGDATIGYVYAWQYIEPGGAGGWLPIPGAASLSYRISTAYLNKWLRLQVAASNASGAATAFSGSAGPATASPGSHYASVAVG